MILEHIKKLIEDRNVLRFHELLEADSEMTEVEYEFYEEGRHIQWWRHVVKHQLGFAELIIGQVGRDFDEEEYPEEWEINEVFPKVIQKAIYVKEEQ